MLREPKWLGTILAFVYFGFAECLSWAASDWPLCMVVSEYQSPNNQSGHGTCATLLEGVMSGLNFVWKNFTHDNVVTAATVIIALFTITLWRSTYMLWEAGEAHSERELRAYLLIVKGDLGTPDGAPTETIINLTVRNSGQTPAYKVTIWADMLFDKDPLSAELIGTENPQVGETIFGPGGRQTTSFYKTGLRIDQKLAMAEDHRAAIYVWGEIRYIDAFGKSRRTKFRTIKRGGPEFRDKPLAFCTEGNEAT